MPMAHEIITHSAEQTRGLGRCLGRLLQRALVMRLCGDLGSGKTCFVQGLAEGLDVPAGYDVTSPTYTLIHEFPARLPLFHVDLYRLGTPADAVSIGMDEILARDTVVAVEWAERLAEEDWPPENLQIGFETIDDDTRRLRLLGSGLAADNLVLEALTIWRSLKF